MGNQPSQRLTEVTGAASTTYLDQSVSYDRGYTYYVRAFTATQNSSFTSANILRLAPATNLRTTNTHDGTLLTWSPNIKASGCKIYRKDSAGKTVTLTTIRSSTASSYVDQSAAAGQRYIYSIRCFKGSTYSDYCNAKSIEISRTPNVIKIENRKEGIFGDWNDLSKLSGYRLYRAENGGRFDLIASVSGAAGKGCYLDSNVEQGVKYTYKVIAFSPQTSFSGRTSSLVRSYQVKLAFAAPLSGATRTLYNSLTGLGAKVIIVNESVDPKNYDGLIIPGGTDINPKLYGEENISSRNIDNKLDSLQMTVLDKFVRAKKADPRCLPGSSADQCLFQGYAPPAHQ